MTLHARLVQEELLIVSLAPTLGTRRTYVHIALAYTSRVAPLKLSDRS